MLSPLLWRKLDNEDIAPHRAGIRKYQRDRCILGKIVERKRVEDYVHPVTLLKRLVLQIEPLQVSGTSTPAAQPRTGAGPARGIGNC